MNFAPKLSVSCLAANLTSIAWIAAPSLLAVAMACKPATAAPWITNLAGLTVPAAVIIMGTIFETCRDPIKAALYPDRLSWLELTSMDCPLDSLLGITSRESNVIPASIIFLVCSKFLKGSAMQANIWPFFIILKSGTSIEAINSDLITSTRSPIFPPLSSYSESE